MQKQCFDVFIIRKVTSFMKSEALSLVLCSGTFRCILTKRKDISTEREAVIATHQSGMGYQAFLNNVIVHHSTLREAIQNSVQFNFICLCTEKSPKTARTIEQLHL